MKTIYKRASRIRFDRRHVCRCILPKLDSRARVNRLYAQLESGGEVGSA